MIIAEVGLSMAVFPTAGHLVSWTKLFALGSTCRRTHPELVPRASTATPTSTLPIRVATVATGRIPAADEGLVDLDLADEQSPVGGDHRAPQLLQDEPRDFVSADAKLALQLLGRDARSVRRHQIRRPEPQHKRCVRMVHDRSGGHRRLPPAPDALPQVTTRQHPSAATTAGRAAEAFRPARPGQMVQAVRLICEPPLKLDDAPRKVRSGHVATLEALPDKTRYARGSL